MGLRADVWLVEQIPITEKEYEVLIESSAADIYLAMSIRYGSPPGSTSPDGGLTRLLKFSNAL